MNRRFGGWAVSRFGDWVIRRLGLRVGLLLVAAFTGLPGLAAQAPRLVSTDSLAAWLARPDTPVLLDVRQAWVSYLQNHLPGAAWLNIETLRSGDGSLPFQLLPAEHYVTLFRRLDLEPMTPVVVYSAGDQLDVDATYVAWILASAGAKRVYLLDGGYAKWDLEGRALTQRYPQRPAPKARFRAKDFRPTVATLNEVKAAVAGSGVMLVDARPAEQYAGSAGAQLRRGHIPRAVSHPWKDDLEKPDLAVIWKSVAALSASYALQGITPDKDIVVYCNSGTEASHVFFALKYLLGYPTVRIYAGSWTQWAEREELPVER